MAFQTETLDLAREVALWGQLKELEPGEPLPWGTALAGAFGEAAAVMAGICHLRYVPTHAHATMLRGLITVHDGLTHLFRF